MTESIGFERVWRFRIVEGREDDFERFNGSAGTWAQLFALAPGYRGTTLQRVAEGPAEYLVIDRWESRAAWDAFRVTHAAAYENLDREAEAFSVSEELVRETDLTAG